MDSVLDQVERILAADEWKFFREDGEPYLHLSISSDSLQYRCVFLGDENSKVLLLYTMLPVQVPEASRLSVCEFICRANHNMKIGNFEIDMDDGEVRFKVSTDVEGAPISLSMIRNMLSISYHTCEDYAPGIIAVVRQFLEPADVIAMIERVH